jgi:Zn-dependent metalloprotease
MRRQLQERIALSMLVSVFSLSAYAQEEGKSANQKITAENGLSGFIVFGEMTSYKSTDFQDIFKEQLGLKSNSNFIKIKSETDPLGFSHEKLQLFHQGIKVEFATYSLHSKSGKLLSMSGEFYSLDNVNTVPKLTKEDAFDLSLKQIDAAKYLWETPEEAKMMNYEKPVGELVLFPVLENQATDKNGPQLRLAYKFDIYATDPVSRGDLYIDAVSGAVLLYNATIKHLGEYGYGGQATSKNNNKKFVPLVMTANAGTRYSGSQSIQTTLNATSYVLSDGTRGAGVMTYNMQTGTNYASAIDFVDADNNWTSTEYANAYKDNGALDAHWGVGKTYDYWSMVHGRNSFDNAGTAIKSYVHYSTLFNNAYWNGSVMTYGDGSDLYFDALTSIDVIGHEIGHAVCEKTANLVYQKESGAMNEAFSDIWAACIEYYAAPNKQRWLIGEDIERRSGHLAMRSMSNPKSEGHPDTYGGTYWYTGTGDSGGVHTNSGVLNHWFYILTDGKIGTNDIGSSYAITGIGIDKSAKIAYRLESVYLSANATYANARMYGIQAAVDLYGIGSLEVMATTNAFYAVGIGAAYTGVTDVTAPIGPINLTASGTTANSTILSWTAATDNVGVTGYYVYNGTALMTTVTGTTYAVTGLTSNTTYVFTVRAIDVAGNLSASSNALTLAIADTYCISKGENTLEEYIDYVAIGGVYNATGADGGYGNYTNMRPVLLYGFNTITLSPGFTCSSHPEHWKVWIDFNKNSVFENSEKVVAVTTTSGADFSYVFSVPATALAGNTRMRVAMKSRGMPNTCETFLYGEVEDYTVNIEEESSPRSMIYSTEERGNYDFKIYPNPTQNGIHIAMEDYENTSYRILNALGQEVQNGRVIQEEISVNGLSSGIYFFEINNNRIISTKRFVKN